jgi:hypothetical protein
MTAFIGNSGHYREALADVSDVLQAVNVVITSDPPDMANT